jgi:hypothetical protein
VNPIEKGNQGIFVSAGRIHRRIHKSRTGPNLVRQQAKYIKNSSAPSREEDK